MYMKPKPKTSVIVVTYNSASTIVKCLKSAVSQSFTEVIVVDNDSVDNTVDIVKSIKQVSLIESKNNLGFGLGNNIGAKTAKGEYLVFLNPDAVLPKDFVKAVSKEYSQKTIGILGFQIINSDGSLEPSCDGFPTIGSLLYESSGYSGIFKNSNAYKKYRLNGWNRQTSRYVPAVSGACMVVQSETFSKVGGFDPGFFLFYEEFDMSKRLKKMGLNSYFSTTTQVLHMRGVSTKQVANEKIEKILNKSRRRYIKKYYTSLGLLVYTVLKKFFDLLDRLLSKIRNHKV